MGIRAVVDAGQESPLAEGGAIGSGNQWMTGEGCDSTITSGTDQCLGRRRAAIKVHGETSPGYGSAEALRRDRQKGYWRSVVYALHSRSIAKRFMYVE